QYHAALPEFAPPRRTRRPLRQYQRVVSDRRLREVRPVRFDSRRHCYSPLVFEAMNVLAKNGVLAMVSVTGGSRQIEVPADKINLGFVLGNKVAFGSVNANREYFESGVKDLSTAELQYPGWLKKLLTHMVKGLENYAEMIRLLTETKGAIKVYCEVAAMEGAHAALAAS